MTTFTRTPFGHTEDFDKKNSEEEEENKPKAQQTEDDWQTRSIRTLATFKGVENDDNAHGGLE